MRSIGPLYYLYMSLLSTFSTNSINILAGVNGSEVSQAVVIALSVILNDLLYLPWPTGFRVPLHLLGSRADVEVGGVWSAGMAYGSTQLVERHLFSLYFMLPLVGVCLGFLFHNWCANFLALCDRCDARLILTRRTRRYPSRAFPGDTLCYVTGMAFAVVGIQAHFSKTLLLFFLPQIFNFILSCPQLFGLVPCPRHRVPRYDPTYQLRSSSTYMSRSFDPDTHLLHPSKTQFLKRTSRLSTVVLRVLAGLGCTELTMLPDGTILEATNLTILNVLLLRLGPMREKRLTQALITVQVIIPSYFFTRDIRSLMMILGSGERSCLHRTLRLGVSCFRRRSSLASRFVHGLVWTLDLCSKRTHRISRWNVSGVPSGECVPYTVSRGVISALLLCRLSYQHRMN